MEPDLQVVLEKLAESFRKNDVQFVLIGAIVPEILIDGKEKDGKGFGIRKTHDVDCTIRVKNWDEYKDIFAKLMQTGFEKRKNQPEHRLYFRDIPADILPYGIGLVQEDQIIWPQTGNRMRTTGFDLLFAMATEEPISDSLSIPVIPLPLAVYSKVIAFLDRKASKDLTDIFYILSHYEEGTVSERRVDPDIPEVLPYETRGAYLLGRDLGGILPEDAKQLMQSFFDDINIPLMQQS